MKDRNWTVLVSLEFFYATRKMLLLSVCFLFVACNHLASEQLRTVSVVHNDARIMYRILMTKDTFLLHEPVIVEIWAKNMSHSTVNYQNEHYSGWTIKGKQGQTYPSHATFYPGTIKIQQGDSTGGRIGLGHYGISTGLYPPYFPEGDYTLSYRCFGDSVPSLTFTVVKPEGEQAKALELYLRSFSEMKSGDFDKLPKQNKDKLYKKRIETFQQVADLYPGSVYAVQALSLAVSASWNYFADWDQGYRFNERLLNEYSDPYGSCFALMKSYYDVINNPEGFRGELEGIIRSSTDSTVVARAKVYLQEISGKK